MVGSSFSRSAQTESERPGCLDVYEKYQHQSPSLEFGNRDREIKRERVTSKNLRWTTWVENEKEGCHFVVTAFWRGREWGWWVF